MIKKVFIYFLFFNFIYPPQSFFNQTVEASSYGGTFHLMTTSINNIFKIIFDLPIPDGEDDVSQEREDDSDQDDYDLLSVSILPDRLVSICYLTAEIIENFDTLYLEKFFPPPRIVI